MVTPECITPELSRAVNRRRLECTVSLQPLISTLQYAHATNDGPSRGGYDHTLVADQPDGSNFAVAERLAGGQDAVDPCLEPARYREIGSDAVLNPTRDRCIHPCQLPGQAILSTQAWDGEAAVSQDRLPGYEARLLRAQPQDDVGDLFRLAETFERRMVRERPAERFVEARGHRRAYHPRGNIVHADATWSHL